ncbi:hypothetical protein ASZ90_014296 [hydrocarbon metagenome]|jgi:uncharacterized protein with ParB-like and HNH nuclease domain|uniref:DUF262 domain-containing protein n=1 Tax=hydrocarbon metagenome TaxID=938273 RepID=A0A0W8F6P5_9ZZZZ
MNANETKLQPILEGTKQYVVPLFQRPYSWDKDQWSRLWDDLMDLSEEMDQSKETDLRTHFMGSIVTMPTTSVPEGVTKYLLIDGQQRLTTIFIILSLLRDSALGKNDEKKSRLAEEIQNTLLVNQYKEETDYFKLLPTQVDRDFFERLVKDRIFDGQNQIIAAYKFFDRKLRQSGLEEEDLKKLMTNHLSVISILLERNDNPYLVFESLNAKGLALSQADLIRNYFFMRIHIKDQERIYSEYWKPMQDSLDLTEFIRHYIMKDGYKVRESDVYFVLKDITSKGDVIGWLEDLRKFSTYYEKITRPEKEGNVVIRLALSRLNRLQITTIYPFLLNCYNKYNLGEITSSDFIEILKTLENFLIRRFICNIPTNQLNKIFSPLNNQIQSGVFANYVEGMKTLLQNKTYPKDNEFKERIKDAKLYGAGDRATKSKLILEKIEESYDHKEKIDFNGLEIEHVMPQTLTDSWKDHLGDDWEKAHELLLHTIGNLTLTAYNPEISNGDFRAKKDYYGQSHLEMNKYFKDIDSWKQAEIEDRAEFLANRALEIWPYFGNEEKQTVEKSPLTGRTPKILKCLGQEIQVNSWRDVLEATMNIIAEYEPEKFAELIKYFPGFIGFDEKRFRSPRKLKNGAFVEVDHLSARSTQRLCYQALETIGMTADDWSVEVADN